VLAIVCPGQGSQTPGFLAPWLELPGLPELAGALSDAAATDLVTHGTTSDEETIKDTAIAQPLLVGAGILSLVALFGQGDDTGRLGGAKVVSGHSVGEITAAAAAGVLSYRDAMTFVALRGRGMAEAAAVTPTGMSAVLGGDPAEVLASIEAAGLTPANNNGAGQIVAAGTLEQLAAFAEQPPAKARVIPLKVAGAFHTTHMAPAVDQLRAAADHLNPQRANVLVASNADGAVLDDGREILDRLVNQVSNPVRWDLCMERFADLGDTGLIEVAPAGTLVGLAKRGLKGVQTLALKTPDDLDAARTMIEEHTA
jgi:[acyl-carrier-protein] S-malonyltransferase